MLSEMEWDIEYTGRCLVDENYMCIFIMKNSTASSQVIISYT